MEVCSDEKPTEASSRPSKKASRPKKYYQVDADSRSVPGYEIVNYDTLQKEKKGLGPKDPWPQGYLKLPNGPWRFPHYDEVSRLLFDRKLGRPPHDVENNNGFWIVSEPMKAVLEAVDPTACDFRRCDVVLTSGEAGPERWLCTVTRAFVGAVDIENSEKLLMRGSVNSLGMHGLTKLAFKPEVIGSAHLFVIGELGSRKFCDQTFKDACKAAKLKGVTFWQVTK